MLSIVEVKTAFLSSFQSFNTVGLVTGRIFGCRKTTCATLIAKLSTGAGAGRKMENQPTEGNLENGRENENGSV